MEELAAALVDVPMRSATTPVEVTVDGYQGLMLEWSVPADTDFSSCDESSFESWTAAGSSPTATSKVPVRLIGCGFSTQMAPGSWSTPCTCRGYRTRPPGTLRRRGFHSIPAGHRRVMGWG